jgi:hypothetical protein
MAVANVGRLLARQSVASSRQTLLIDWDLEAPSLPFYFTISQPAERGLIEYFHDLAHLLRGRRASTPEYGTGFPSTLAAELPLDRYLCRTEIWKPISEKMFFCMCPIILTMISGLQWNPMTGTTWDR